MCTTITYQTKDNYFGRNLDLDFSYHEEVTTCPRNYPLSFKYETKQDTYLAIIGMATVVDDCPLFYDATNEKGLGMVGLSFPENADFKPAKDGKTNVASFEFILWVLSQCEGVSEACQQCENLDLTDSAFSSDYPVSPLHWMISNSKESIVVEPVKDKVAIYDNPIGVLTDNPTFNKQLLNLNNYRHLSPKVSDNLFSKVLDLDAYSRDMGGIGFLGDLSSMSRFVKVASTKLNAVADNSEASDVSQFFHILKSVEQQKGLCYVDESSGYEYTIYSPCVNIDKGIYYYTTYKSSQIVAIDMHRENLDSSRLIRYPLQKEWSVLYQNK